MRVHLMDVTGHMVAQNMIYLMQRIREIAAVAPINRLQRFIRVCVYQLNITLPRCRARWQSGRRNRFDHNEMTGARMARRFNVMVWMHRFRRKGGPNCALPNRGRTERHEAPPRQNRRQ